MARLTEAKVRWIVRRMERGEPVSGIARAQGVSRQWVNRP